MRSTIATLFVLSAVGFAMSSAASAAPAGVDIRMSTPHQRSRRSSRSARVGGFSGNVSSRMKGAREARATAGGIAALASAGGGEELPQYKRGGGCLLSTPPCTARGC